MPRPVNSSAPERFTCVGGDCWQAFACWIRNRGLCVHWMLLWVEHGRGWGRERWCLNSPRLLRLNRRRRLDPLPAAQSHSNQMHERHGSRDSGVEVGRRDRVDGATGTATGEYREPRQEPWWGRGWMAAAGRCNPPNLLLELSSRCRRR